MPQELLTYKIKKKYTYAYKHAHLQKRVWILVNHHQVWLTLSNILPIGTQWIISFWKVVLYIGNSYAHCAHNNALNTLK